MTFRQALSFSFLVVRSRWREVLWLLLLDFVRQIQLVLPNDLRRDLAGNSWIFLLLRLFLWAGFLRLSVTRGAERQSLGDLLQTGAKYLGRLFGFGIIVSLPVISFIVVYIVAIKQGWLPRINRSELPLRFAVPCFLYLLLLLKPILCIPSTVLLEDCTLREAWRQMRKVQFLRMSPVVIWFVLSSLLSFLLIPIARQSNSSGFPQVFLVSVMLVLDLSSYLLSLATIQLVGAQLNPPSATDESVFKARLNQLKS